MPAEVQIMWFWFAGRFLDYWFLLFIGYGLLVGHVKWRHVCYEFGGRELNLSEMNQFPCSRPLQISHNASHTFRIPRNLVLFRRFLVVANRITLARSPPKIEKCLLAWQLIVEKARTQIINRRELLNEEIFGLLMPSCAPGREKTNNPLRTTGLPHPPGKMTSKRFVECFKRGNLQSKHLSEDYWKLSNTPAMLWAQPTRGVYT